MVRPTRFEVKQGGEGATPVLTVCGELDMHTTEVLSKQLEESLSGEIATLTLDLRELEFMDSTGLRLLIELNDRSRNEAWRLRLLRPANETASLILRVTGTDTALPFEDGAQQ
jgi:stage II sporulation protein AA (anti-sigma F factor antagonist)